MLLLAGAVVLVSAPGGPFTPRDKAFYLTPEAANLIRPGLVIKIAGVDIANDGTMKARVKLTDPKGAPLDRDGIQTAGSVSTSLMIARIPKGQTQYLSYTTRVPTSPITGVSATQAGADSGGAWQKVADGDYTYTFGTKLPSGFDKTATHSVGAWGSRNITEFNLGTQYDDDVFTFVPDGSKVTVTRDVIRTATCNKCHTQIAFHGGSRRSMELCVLCHQPQSVDPDTGNTVDLPVMLHKIHMGSSLPSVIAGGKYVIIGNAQSVHDYSDVVFPANARSCTVCHESGPAQANAYLKPSRRACGACHDDVNFDTGKNHVNLPQVSDNLCAGCHPPQGELEFDTSIMGAHTIPTQAKALPGVVFEIVQVADASPGKKPTVVFTIKDKAGNPIRPSQMSGLSVYYAAANPDFSTYVRETATGADGAADGRAWWTFGTAIPATAKGSLTFAIEGRRDVTLLPGTVKQQTVRDSGANKQLVVSVDGSKPQPRRTVVATDKCNACHKVLYFHGGNRNSTIQCPICHNPTAVGGQTSIDFPVMIHRIHTGRDLTRPYALGNTSFNDVGFPGDRRACEICHVNESEQLPLTPGLLNVNYPGNVLNPMGPATAACTGCHDSVPAASHALSATNSLGESCAACHGPNGEFSVDKVHAR